MVKLFVKLDDKGMITECSLSKYSSKEEEPADSIDVTEEQIQKIREKYETYVVDGKISKQIEGDEFKAIKARQEAENAAPAAEQAPTEQA